MTVHQHIRDHLQALLPDEDSVLEDDTPLLELGIIDSIAMVGLLAFIKEHLQVTIPDDRVTPRNFASISALAQLIEQLKRDEHA